MINPGATGADPYLNLSLGGRMQWTGFPNAPKTTYLYLSTPASKFRSAFMKRTFGKVRRNNKSVRHPNMRVSNVVQAFGGQLLADQYGAFRTLKFAGSYAVHIPINREYKLSFGTNVGLSSHTFLPQEAQVLSVMTGSGTSDAVYNAQLGSGSQYIMDIDAGLYFYSSDLFAGFSANQLTKDLVRFGNTMTNFAPQMHFYGTAGYRFHPNNQMDVTPALLVKYVKNAPVSIEANVVLEFNKQFWTGLSYRHQDAVAVLLGMKFSDTFRVGYSYDLSISRMLKYNSGGHEIVLSLTLGQSRSSMSRVR